MRRLLIVCITLILSLSAPIKASLAFAPQPEQGAPSQTAAVHNFKWTFGGSEAGKSTYQTHSDGRFESTTELTLAGMNIKSRLTGKKVDGTITEFEMVNNQSGSEVKVEAKNGKAKVTAGGRSQERDFKPSTVVFGNFHPILSETFLKAIDPSKEGPQSIDVLVLDGGISVKAQITKKKARTIETPGKKITADVYLARFGAVEFDIYMAEGSRFAAWDIPSQKLQSVLSGYEALLVDPTTLYPELSQPTVAAKVEKSVKIRVRDGVELVADVVRPAVDGKYPVILLRTPYGREILSQLEGQWWAKRGYVHIVQDVRGRNDSGGDWIPFVHERRDGYDTIDWISKQPWSNSNVGMIGGSYVGWVQWAAAVEAHPALKCIVPQVSPPDPFFNFPIDHGIPMLFGAMWWSNFVKDKKTPQTPQLPKDMDKLRTLPLSRVDEELFGSNFPFYDQWLEKQTPAAFGSANFMADMNKVRIPVLHISGWWDGDGIGTKLNWAKMRSLGHRNQWLIYGPWSHAFNSSSKFGDVDYGPDAVTDLDSIYLRWFDTWLKGKSVSWDKQSKVRVFVTGANEWRELNDWPDTQSAQKTLYLSADFPANGITSRGELVEAAPKRQEPDRYTYNPAALQVPKEMKEISSFGDMLAGGSTIVKIEPAESAVLIYKSAAVIEPMDITGPIDVDLYFSTSAKDTDFFAIIVDIDEKGEMRMIGLPGKIRARYLSGWERPTLLQAGRIYKAGIALWDTAHRVKKGHRLGLIISSDMFPSYARNLNTGEPIKDATRMVAAHQTVYHDALRPSALKFRVLSPRGE